MSGLLGELVGEGLEVVDVDLASAEAFPLVGLVELPADLPGPDGDCGDQSVDPELESVLLLLLLLSYRPRARTVRAAAVI